MSWQASIQILVADRRPRRCRAAARPLHGARLRAHATTARRPATACSCPVERVIYRDLPRRPEAGAALERLHDQPDRVQRRCRSSSVYLIQRLQGSLPFNPTDRSASSPMGAFNGVGQLRDQHQLAVVLRRADDEPPHADGRASRSRTSSRPRPAWRSRSALIRGITRSGIAQPRQLLGRPDAHDRAHPDPAVVRDRRDPDVAGRGSEPARATRSRPRSTRRRRSPSSTSPAGRSPRRRRSRSSVRTAAARTTPTPPIRSRTRPGSATCSRSSRSC